jgi:tetratricopeptide (TPR) repeat protein
MKIIAASLLFFLITLPLFGQAGTSDNKALSPAEQRILQAQETIKKRTSDPEAYNALASAYARRARETGDASYYQRAEDALQKSLTFAPGNFEAQKLHVAVLLGQQEFAAALDLATKLNTKTPDDVMLYGYLIDANVALGNYKEAETAAHWMLNLRPGNVPSLTRTATLRELFGDEEGALEMLSMALQATPPTETEELSWLMSRMADLKLASGKTQEADELAQQALTTFPGYYCALRSMAKVRMQQKRYDDAVVLLRQSYQAAPDTAYLFELAHAQQMAGRAADAQETFADFEHQAILETNLPDNANRELVFYYADQAHQPQKALEIARQELARRHDVFTLDAYAWALYRNGQYPEARKQIDTALAVGIQDEGFARHAAQITAKSGPGGDAVGR